MTDPKQLAEQVVRDNPYSLKFDTAREFGEATALAAIEARDRQFVDLICFTVDSIDEIDYPEAESEPMIRALKMISYALCVNNPSLQVEFAKHDKTTPGRGEAKTEEESK